MSASKTVSSVFWARREKNRSLRTERLQGRTDGGRVLCAHWAEKHEVSKTAGLSVHHNLTDPFPPQQSASARVFKNYPPQLICGNYFPRQRASSNHRGKHACFPQTCGVMTSLTPEGVYEFQTNAIVLSWNCPRRDNSETRLVERSFPSAPPSRW